MINNNMLKLLTEEYRHKVEHEYFIRRIIVALSALILVLVIGMVGVLPSYMLSNIRQSEALSQTKVANSAGLRGDETMLKEWLSETNKRLKTVSPSLDTDRPSNFVDEVLKQQVESIHITNFSWTRAQLGKEKGDILLSITGLALDRQSLITFREHMNASERFSNVVLPISDLAKDKDIVFQIKFSLASTSLPVNTP